MTRVRRSWARGRFVLVDDDLNAVGQIEVTSVEPTTFAEVTWAFAAAEGEGFADLDDWRAQHREFWSRIGHQVTDTTPLLCIYFTLLSRND